MIWQFQFTEPGQELEDQLIQSFVEEAECKHQILNKHLNEWRDQIECKKEKVECKVCWDTRQVDMQETTVIEHEDEKEQKEVSSEEEIEAEVKEKQQEELSSEEETDEDDDDKDVEELEAAQLEQQVMTHDCMTTMKEVVKKTEGLQRYLKNICEMCSFCW